MIRLNEVTSLTYINTKMWLPYNIDNKLKGTYFFTLNTTIKSIASLVNNEKDRVSNMGNIYNAYYYDYKLLPRGIKTKRVINSGLTVAKAKKQRLQYYKQMETACPDIKTPINLTSLSGKNFIYDLNPILDLYTKQKKIESLGLVPKLRAYFDTLSNVISTPIEKYNCEYIFVDLDDYKKYRKDTHILHNILLLLRRSEKVIEKFSGYKFKIVFYNNKGAFIFDTSTDLARTNYSKVKKLLNRLQADIIDKDAVNTENAEVANYIAKKTISKTVSKMTGEEDDSFILPEDIQNALDADDEVVDTVKNKLDDDIGEITDDESDVEEPDIFNGDEELKKEYNEAIIKKNTGIKSEASLKRDQMLREKQKEVVIKGKTIEQITKDKTIQPIPVHYIDNPVVTNENIKQMKFSEMNKTYMETTYQKDVTNMIMSLNTASIPVHILNVKVEDTSDSLTLKETYTVTLEGEDRIRHTLKFDLPLLIDNKYLYINGNKKTLSEQFYPYPVIKISEVEVQVVTNYQKIRIGRYGTKFNRNSEKLKKLLADPKKYGATCVNGDNRITNRDYLTCLEYDELAKLYNEIKVGKATFLFNAKTLSKVFDDKEKSTLDKILVGYETNGNKKSPIYYDRNNEDHVDLVTLILSYASEEVQLEFSSMSSGKKYVYNRVYVMNKYMPLIILLAFFEGLDTVLRKFNDKNVKFFDNTKDKRYQYIKFKDGYLGYPLSDMEACLLFNGLLEVPTGAYTVEQMNDRNTYLDMFEYLYKSSYIAGALINFYDFMIDPITFEILQTLDYPTDLVSLFIYASNILADNDFVGDTKMTQYRLRRNEVIPVILYKNIVRAYTGYRRTATNPNPSKISMDQNAVLKELMAIPTMEDYSTLSPMVEAHKDGIVSMKGCNGMNTERSYTLEKRSYDDSMIGIIGISTSPDKNCGITRQLVAEPKVLNVRGFMEVTDMKDVDKKLTDANIITPVEYLTPMTSTHDEAQRTAMATKQTGHVIPVEENCPMLVTMGMDTMIHYRTGNDFSVVAKQDGKVIDYDEEAKLMIIQYKDGTKQAIDLSSHVVKNGGGGFFLSNKLVAKVKDGQSFKKDAILAYDPKYYREQGILGNKMTHGALMKVAVLSNFATYEDSTFITRYMSQKMATNITMQKHVIIGANANVDYIVKPGQEITAGEDLIRYESAYDDVELNRLLATVRDDMKEDIINLGKSRVYSPYTGKIEDVIIYSGVELDEMTPSLQKIVKDYQRSIKKRTDMINKYDPDGNKNSAYRLGVLSDKPYGKIEADQFGKIKGYNIGKGLLIEFYITYHDELSDGESFSAY